MLVFFLFKNNLEKECHVKILCGRNILVQVARSLELTLPPLLD